MVKPNTIRTMLSLAVSNKGWSLHQLDVKNNAFLHEELNEIIYMHQPLGYWILDIPIMCVS